MTDKLLSEITAEDIERARLAVEDELIEMRDARIGILGRGNGLVVNECDRTPSSIIRMSTPDAIVKAIETILGAPLDSVRGSV